MDNNTTDVRIDNHACKDNVTVCILIACSLAYYPITYACNELVNKYIQYGAWWDSALCMALYLIVLIKAIPTIVKRQNRKTILLLIVAVLVFLINILVNTDGAPFAIPQMLPFFTYCFPFLFIGVSTRDYPNLDKLISIFSKVALVAALIWVAIILFDVNRGVRVAYMNVSYSVLPSTLFRIYYYFRSRKSSDCIWMVIGIVCQILWGTRGPVLFVFMFTALCLIFGTNAKQRLLISAILTIIGLILFFNMYSILMYVNTLFQSWGIINGGIIKLLTETDLSDGRVDLLTEISPYIDKHWLFGGGIYSDRAAIGVYVHFLPIEFLCDYGIFGGTVFFVIIIANIVKGIINQKDYQDFRWAVLWIAVFIGFFKLFISGSYLTEPYFYFLMGLLLNGTMKLESDTMKTRRSANG